MPSEDQQALRLRLHQLRRRFLGTIEQFKELQTALSSEDQAQIAELYLTDRDSAVSKMIGIAADKV